MTRPDDYLLGMSPAEIRRLERQHDTWRKLTERAWDIAGFRTGQTIVDLGSGPGFTSLDLMSRVGASGRVIAVDASPAATDHLSRVISEQRLANLDVVTSDVASFDWSPWRPDGVFARWLFSFLPNPEVIVGQIATALAPGATVAIMDYWNYRAIRTEPSSPMFTKVFRAVYDSFENAGGSLDVAGKLPTLFGAAGLRVTVTEPLCQVGRPGSPVWRWITEFQELYLPTLVEKKYLTLNELQEYERWWSTVAQDQHALVFSPPILCVVGVKA